jgi:hypothetical protein
MEQKMDQSEMEQIMEFLKKMMAKMHVNHEEMMASLKGLNATTMAWHGEMKASPETMDARPVKTRTRRYGGFRQECATVVGRPTRRTSLRCAGGMFTGDRV